MDIVWESKAVELMVRLIRQDYRRIYAAPYTYLPLSEESLACPLERATPESQGVPSAALTRLFERVNGAKKQNIRSLMVMRHGKVIGEGAWQPYSLNYTQLIYSMSKSVTATAIGMAVDEGLVSLDERLVDIFADKIRIPLHSFRIRKLTVWNLLTMSTGVTFNEVGSALVEDWVQAFMEAEPKFEAGSAFEYNSLNSYMLSAVLKAKTGMGVVEFLRERLFEPLGIQMGTWETCPMGVEKGGWGLSITLEDISKIGQLYLNGGTWLVDGQEKRLLSEEWVKAATTARIATPKGEMTYGYGYQIWMGKRPGSYLFSGAFGQYVIMLPDRDMVVSVYSNGAILFAQGMVMDAVEELADSISSDVPLEEDAEAQDTLKSMIGSLRFLWDNKADETALREVGRLLDGRSFDMLDNSAGLLPFILQGVHTNFTTGMERISFSMSANGIEVCLKEQALSNTLYIPVGGDTGNMVLRFGQEKQLVAVRGVGTRLAQDGAELKIYVYFLNTPDVRIITLRVSGGMLMARFEEVPSVAAASKMLFELTGISSKSFLKKIMTQDRSTELYARLKHFTIPVVLGTESSRD